MEENEVTVEAVEAIEAGEPGEHTGAMVAFFLPEDASARLAYAGEGGLPVGEHHITLVYLGDTATTDLDKALIVSRLGMFATGEDAISGIVNGLGRFMNPDEEAIYASFDCPALPGFRQRLAQMLQSHEIQPAQNHGFTPHITLAYLPEGTPTPDLRPEQIELTFDELVLAWGSERIPFKLHVPGGATPFLEAETEMREPVPPPDPAPTERSLEYLDMPISPTAGSETGREWEITIIGPNSPADLAVIDGREYVRSKNGRLYSVAALRDSAPLWEGVKVFDNHLTDKEFNERQGMRRVSDEWLGSITGPRWDESSRRLLADFHLVDEGLARKLTNAYRQGVLHTVGLSIDTEPVLRTAVIAGQSVPVIEGFRRIHSVDVVAEPAAGGGFNRLIAAEVLTKETDMDNEEKVEQVVEAPAAVVEAPKTEPKPDAAMEAVRRLECQIMLRDALDAAKLTPELRALVAEAFPKTKTFEQAEVDGFIKRAKEAQAAMDTSGRVTGAGSPQVSVGLDPRDKAEAEFLRLLAGNSEARALKSITADYVAERQSEAFKAWVNAGQPNYGTRRLSEWAYNLLGGDPMTDQRAFESVTTSGMASIVKNTVNLLLAANYSKRNLWFEPVVAQHELDTIDTATLARVFGTGSLPVVNEGAAYTEMAWADEEEAPTFVKKGGYIGVTLETLLGDKLNQVRSLPNRLADSWYKTLSGMVAGVFTTNTAAGPVLADSGALFNNTAVTTAGGHANLLTTALSWAAFDAARSAMRKQTDMPLGVGEKLLIEPKFLLVPVDLEATANQIANSEYVPSTSASVSALNQYRGKVQPVVVPTWTDATDWALMADPAEFPAIHLLFLRGLRVPALFTADQEVSGAMFTNDVLRFKVRLMTWRFSSTYDVAPVSDFRPLHKSNVAG